jgi:hypothetical protein
MKSKLMVKWRTMLKDNANVGDGKMVAPPSALKGKMGERRLEEGLVDLLQKFNISSSSQLRY